MHTLKMKKKGFIKNKVVEATITRSVKKATLIPLTHVYQLTVESDVAWGVWSQRLPNIIYAMKFSFTKISCCTCEWALWRNMCKHQIVMILTCINITHEYIIHYYWNMVWITLWRVGSHVCGLTTYSKWYGVNDDGENEHLEGDDEIMEFNVLMTMEHNDFPMGAIIGFSDTINSSTPMERVFA